MSAPAVLAWASAVGISFEWSDDWHVGSHVAEYPDAYDSEPSECLLCTALAADGTVLAALGCVDDPSNDYAREIESELALEALQDVGRRDFRDVPLFAAVDAIGGAA